MTPAPCPDLAHRRAIPVQDDLDTFWSNTGILLMNQEQRFTRQKSTHMLQKMDSHTADSSHSHSRTNTMTSSWSFYEASTPQSSIDDRSRPASQHTRDEHLPLSPEKKSNAARTLLSKGSRILRRQGSKFSLLSSHNSDGSGAERSPSRDASSTETLTKHQRKASAADLRREELKRGISDPFDFKHVTHTDRRHFENLDRVHGNELISEFSAIRAGQRTRNELQGIRVDSLPSALPSPEVEKQRPKTSPTATITPTLPVTPPRPQPPPKDDAALMPAPLDIRMSRSYENFSRPGPRSPTLPVSPASTVTPTNGNSSLSSASASSISELRQNSSASLHDMITNHSDPRNSICAPNALSDLKPLPNVPPFIHALTTSDDTARPLRLTPLPRLPADLADVPEEDEPSADMLNGRHTRTRSRRLSLRHAQTFPSSKDAPGSRSSFGYGESTSAADMALSAAFVEHQLPSGHSAASTIDGKRASEVPESIEVQDWEDAIDYSWDHATENDSHSDWTKAHARLDARSLPVLPSQDQLDPQSHLLPPTIAPALEQGNISPQAGSDMSTPDTGLLMNSPRPIHTSSSYDGSEKFYTPISPDHPSPLFGLGIEAPRITGTESNFPVCNREDDPTPRQGRVNAAYQSTGSAISKSSSQESIILSIASSIMSTQRSSNSSASLTDYTPSMISLKPTRIESLPESPHEECSDPMTEGPNMGDGVRSAARDATPTPRASANISSAALLSTAIHPQLSHLPWAIEHRRTKSLASPLVSKDASPAPLPGMNSPRKVGPKCASQCSPTHSRTNSGSRIPVPVRTSSIAGTADLKHPQADRRKRSATTNSISRPRHVSRGSYSLFPGSTPLMAV